MMERDTEQLSERIDLGAVSAETQGPTGPIVEISVISRFPGITDE